MIDLGVTNTVITGGAFWLANGHDPAVDPLDLNFPARKAQQERRQSQPRSP